MSVRQPPEELHACGTKGVVLRWYLTYRTGVATYNPLL